MLKRNMVHIIGSDSHNASKRNFCLKKAIESIENIIGKNKNILVYDNPLKAIKGEKITPFDIISDNKKKYFSRFIKFFYNKSLPMV